MKQLFTIVAWHMQLLRQLDANTALDISGIPDEYLRGKLRTLMDNLHQLRSNSAVSDGPTEGRGGGELCAGEPLQQIIVCTRMCMGLMGHSMGLMGPSMKNYIVH
jgi:hypothetical protein